MKINLRIISLVLGISTLAYVSVLLARKAPEPAATVVLPAQLTQLKDSAENAVNAIDNLDHKLKADASVDGLPYKSGDEVKELSNVIAEQQKMILQLISKPAKENGLMEQVVTLTGVASTLITMLLAWRKDRREIIELCAKLAATGTAGAEKTS